MGRILNLVTDIVSLRRVQAGSSVVELKSPCIASKQGGTKRGNPRAAWGGAGAPLRFAPSPRLGNQWANWLSIEYLVSKL